MKKNALVCVVKENRDLEMVLKSRIYRIPVLRAPKREADYLAFYQPSSTGGTGHEKKIKGFDGCIRYYSRIEKKKILPRFRIVRNEALHPRAHEKYYRVKLGRIQKLKNPITNKRCMRVTFGFTTLAQLKKCKEVKQLFDLPPIEEMVEQIIKRLGLPYQREYTVRLTPKKRYRVDFAVFPESSQKRRVAIECDGVQSHSGPTQKRMDRIKDAHLKRSGWTILRLGEQIILTDPLWCRKKISMAT